MKLGDLMARRPLLPGIDGGKIPWDDYDFSDRMLSEHLDQRHDAASRRLNRTDKVERVARVPGAGGDPRALRALARDRRSGLPRQRQLRRVDPQ